MDKDIKRNQDGSIDFHSTIWSRIITCDRVRQELFDIIDGKSHLLPDFTLENHLIGLLPDGC